MGFGQLKNVKLEFLKFWTLMNIMRHYRFVLSVSILQIPFLLKLDSNKILLLFLLHILFHSLTLNFVPPHRLKFCPSPRLNFILLLALNFGFTYFCFFPCLSFVPPLYLILFLLSL